MPAFVAVRPEGVRVELGTLPSRLCDTYVDALIRSYLPTEYQEVIINFKPEVPDGENPYFVWWLAKNGQLWCKAGNFPPILIRHGVLAFPTSPILSCIGNEYGSNDDHNIDDNQDDEDLDLDYTDEESLFEHPESIKFVGHYNANLPASFYTPIPCAVPN